MACGGCAKRRAVIKAAWQRLTGGLMANSDPRIATQERVAAHDAALKRITEQSNERKRQVRELMRAGKR